MSFLTLFLSLKIDMVLSAPRAVHCLVAAGLPG